MGAAGTIRDSPIGMGAAAWVHVDRLARLHSRRLRREPDLAQFSFRACAAAPC
jgi:hypothetical protein